MLPLLRHHLCLHCLVRFLWQKKTCLQQLADDFLSGVAAVDPLNSSSCTYCGLQALCRVEVPRNETVSAMVLSSEAGSQSEREL